MKISMREKTITVSHFACEECPFETENLSEAEHHEVTKHPVKEQRALGSRIFFWFSRQDGFAAYAKGQGWEPGDWEGPGWYGVKERLGMVRLVSADAGETGAGAAAGAARGAGNDSAAPPVATAITTGTSSLTPSKNCLTAPPLGGGRATLRRKS